MITSSQVTYRSPIFFTPFLEEKVDRDELEEFLRRTYRDANLSPEEVDTGAVIITGYAARKENAEAILNLFSKWAGKFVCATAGPNLESLMAAHGSGAVSKSIETGKTILNVDIGGGTTKFAIIKKGNVIETESIRVGARIIGLTTNNVVTRIDAPALMAGNQLQLDLKMGKYLESKDQRVIVRLLVSSLFELIERRNLSELTQNLMETLPIKFDGQIDELIFSGGVSEYIYRKEKSNFGDLGFLMGEEIACRILSSSSITLGEPVERIRATVIGASQNTVQISGNTIFISNGNTLPLRNLLVVKAILWKTNPTIKEVEDTLRSALKKYDVNDIKSDKQIALSIDLAAESSPTSDLLVAIARGIISVWRSTFEEPKKLVLMLNMDIARLIGNLLHEEYFPEVICLDGVEVTELEYVDIGREIQSSGTVPVILKSLVFLKQ